MNLNEVLLDRVRSVTYSELGTNKLLFRLTQIEDASLKCTSEGDEIVDAMGSPITTLYRAKKAEFTATNSLISLDLAAAQYGTTKNVATKEERITSSTYDILTISEGKVNLSKIPKDITKIKWIYSIVDGDVGTSYTAGSTASATEFVISETGEITVPTGLTGKIYVEYEYETEEAIEIINKTSEFPKAGSLKVYAFFRDKCNENLVYSGVIIASKSKINPEQIELALTSTGKHSLTFNINKDYCSEDADLFAIVLAK